LLSYRYAPPGTPPGRSGPSGSLADGRGFRVWWRRLHGGSDDDLDNTHLMVRGPVARRVKAWATTTGVPVICCKAGECKHLIAEEHLAAHPSPRPWRADQPSPADAMKITGGFRKLRVKSIGHKSGPHTVRLLYTSWVLH
jgi:hypothetical protein